MRVLTAVVALLLSANSFASNIIVNGTRFIYQGKDKEITVSMTNTADRPAIAQAWLDTGNSKETPDKIKTPFQLTPPVSRLEAKGGQALRIKLMNKGAVVQDRESLWWLNILDIPPTVKSINKADDNALQLAIRSRFKFIYRPEGLGNPEQAPAKMEFNATGKALTIRNPTPFYITLTKIKDKSNGKSLNSKTIMLAPKSSETVELDKPLKAGEKVTITNINDYGATIAREIVIK